MDPSDPECPDTAPNKASGQSPDIGAELSGGCYGFATKHMHWPEQLIVGGTEKNRTGQIVRYVGGEKPYRAGGQACGRVSDVVFALVPRRLDR